MNSSLYCGKVWHERLSPKTHAFAYPHFMLALELDELENLDLNPFLFGLNRFALLSMWERDYLQPGAGSLKAKCQTLLQQHGFAVSAPRITVMTLPLFLGYAFNPVNFYFVRGVTGEIAAFIAEVHNTFGEGHVYVMRPDSQELPIRFSFPKDFFVSPFFPVSGAYQLRVLSLDQDFRIEIDLLENDAVIFKSGFFGLQRPLRNRQLLWTLAEYPLCIAGAMPRICWQASVLYFRKHLTLWDKPETLSENTIRKMPGMFDQLRLRLVRCLRKFHCHTSVP